MVATALCVEVLILDKLFNKKDLKKQSREFRSIASRTLTSDFNMFDNNLKRLINYIDKDVIIQKYIATCIKSDDNFTIEEDVKSVSNGYGEYIFENYIEEEKEVSYIYQILKYIAENKVNCRSYIYPYSFSKQYQDKLKGFCDNVVQPLVNYIDGNYERIFIEMGYDEESNFNIVINGGQVILAKDNANVTATQNNYNQLDNIVEILKESIKQIQDEDLKLEIIDNVEGLQGEIKSNQKKGSMKAFISALENLLPKVGGFIEVTAAITQLITFAQAFIK